MVEKLILSVVEILGLGMGRKIYCAKDTKFLQEPNIKEKSVTFFVLKFFKFKYFKFIQRENIYDIVITFSVLNFDIDNSFIELQDENI